MKHILLAGILSLFFYHSFAQNNTMEAKAAYLLAEEEYSIGKYESCLKYLDEAIHKLSNTNSKILYLKIQCLQEIARQDEKQTSKLSETIEAFEKAPDISSFDEEKQLEVMKLKLRLKKEGNLNVTETDMTEVFRKFEADGFWLGATEEEMKSSRPDYFVKATRGPSADSSIIVYSLFDAAGKLSSVTFKNNKVSGITITVSPPNENKQFSNGEKLLNSWLSRFPANPEITTDITSSKGTESTITHYKWKDGKASVFLSYIRYKFNFGLSGKAYNSSVVVMVNYQ